MKLIRNPELKGILAILLIALVIGILLAGTSGKLEQWGLPWFTGPKAMDKIIFVSNRSGSNQIYAMDPDGSRQEQLTSGDIKILSAPSISTGANRIAFVGMAGSATQVFAIGANGTSPRALTTSSNSKRQPGYGPDGKTLSYIESGRVFVAELSGANPDPVLPTEKELAMAINDPSGGRGAIPMYSVYAWGPDGESIAGVTSHGGAQTLVYLPSHDEEALRFGLGDPRAKVVGLSWAVDTPLMAISIQLGESSGIVVLFDPGQEQPQAVYSAPASLGAPAMSPDGLTVVFPARRHNLATYMGLVKIDLETGKEQLLCKGRFEHPVFSPDGEKILAAQLSPKTRKRSIVTIDPISGEITTLANKGDNFNAVWTPQSQ